MQRGYWLDGQKNGLFESYFYESQVWLKGVFTDDEQCGEWVEDGEKGYYGPCMRH